MVWTWWKFGDLGLGIYEAYTVKIKFFELLRGLVVPLVARVLKLPLKNYSFVLLESVFREVGSPISQLWVC